MSNKLILQSNNDILSTNNSDLQNLIELANALPENNSTSNPINCDSEWMSCANLPTTLLAAPGAATYYLEVPNNVRCILFRNNAYNLKNYYCATLISGINEMTFSGIRGILSADCIRNPIYSNNILSISAGSDFLSAEYIFLYDAY